MFSFDGAFTSLAATLITDNRFGLLCQEISESIDQTYLLVTVCNWPFSFAFNVTIIWQTKWTETEHWIEDICIQQQKIWAKRIGPWFNSGPKQRKIPWAPFIEWYFTWNVEVDVNISDWCFFCIVKWMCNAICNANGDAFNGSSCKYCVKTEASSRKRGG